MLLSVLIKPGLIKLFILLFNQFRLKNKSCKNVPRTFSVFRSRTNFKDKVLIFVSQPCSRQMSTFLLVLTHKITTAFITNKARNIWNEICDFPFWTSFEKQACVYVFNARQRSYAVHYYWKQMIHRPMRMYQLICN